MCFYFVAVNHTFEMVGWPFGRVVGWLVCLSFHSSTCKSTGSAAWIEIAQRRG